MTEVAISGRSNPMRVAPKVGFAIRSSRKSIITIQNPAVSLSGFRLPLRNFVHQIIKILFHILADSSTAPTGHTGYTS